MTVYDKIGNWMKWVKLCWKYDDIMLKNQWSSIERQKKDWTFNHIIKSPTDINYITYHAIIQHFALSVIRDCVWKSRVTSKKKEYAVETNHNEI